MVNSLSRRSPGRGTSLNLVAQFKKACPGLIQHILKYLPVHIQGICGGRLSLIGFGQIGIWGF
jgi:hypothetical protein